MIKFLAVLDTMWGNTPGREAPGLFRINPKNHSGRRLYRITSKIPKSSLTVTNSSALQVGSAKEHGKPDLSKLSHVLSRWTWDIVLVCGKVAQSSFYQIPIQEQWIVVEMPHPASRNLPNDLLDNISESLGELLRQSKTGIRIISEPPKNVWICPLEERVQSTVRFMRVHSSIG